MRCIDLKIALVDQTFPVQDHVALSSLAFRAGCAYVRVDAWGSSYVGRVSLTVGYNANTSEHDVQSTEFADQGKIKRLQLSLRRP